MIDIRFEFVFREAVACEYIDIVIIVNDGHILAVSDARVFDFRVGLRILHSETFRESCVHPALGGGVELNFDA
jgi:hypothetical protein